MKRKHINISNLSFGHHFFFCRSNKGIDINVRLSKNSVVGSVIHQSSDFFFLSSSECYTLPV